MCGINGEGIDVQRLGVLPVGFDDGERMVVDREGEGRVAGCADDTETITDASLRVNKR